MTPTLRAFVATALMVPCAALAGPTEWMPVEADCSATGEALQTEAAEALASCMADARADGFVGTKAIRAVTDRCMAVRGWERVEKTVAVRYAPFCAVAARLQESTFDDPVEVADLPNPNPA